MLESIGAPACATNQRGDVLAANRLGFAHYSDIFRPESLPLSMPRYVFLDQRAPSFFLDWDTVADDTAAALRIEAGRAPHDRQLTDLVGELAPRSDAFATRWARHNVRLHRTASKRLHHALVGELELTADALALPGEDLGLVVYTAAADSPAQEKLDFLARWSDQGAAAGTAEAEVTRSQGGQGR